MKTLIFKGYSNVPSSCEYSLTELDGKPAIIFRQPALTGTRLGNMIESLTMHVLATELPGIPPDQVRVFEHYNPELNPPSEWLEVKFMNSGIIAEDKGTVRMLVEMIMSAESEIEYFVDDPMWTQVSEEDIAVLSKTAANW